MRQGIYLFILFIFIITSSFAQQNKNEGDTTVKMLDSVRVSAIARLRQNSFLPPVENMRVYAGKKTNVVTIDAASGNRAANLARMLFAPVPGLTIWEMDGAGTQINIGSRGTDTHRSIEMNMRQNGYNFNSDVFGYPEAHYTPPMEGIQRVELVRGSAALQFGPQFGGMLNYVMKEGDSTKPLDFETEQTAGSNGFFNSFTSLGGTKGRISYYGYYDNRNGNGWRKNAAFHYHAYYAHLTYAFNQKADLTLEFSRMDYVQQIAGGLTDAQFAQDPRQSLRARNFFNPEINIPALIFRYQFTPDTKMQITAHYLFGQRNSVQFLNTPDIKDTVNTALDTYNPRQVDRDYYNGFTTEARLLHTYRLGNVNGTLAGGLRYFNETTLRKQKGVGTTGSDFDLSLVKLYGIDLHLHTGNAAAFVENIFQLSPRFSITPGVRYELIQTSMTGVINNASYPVSYKANRSFPLLGTGLQYQSSQSTQVYGNISQAYRPYIYANVTPADQLGVIDPDLKDSKGYDIDLGYRGRIKNRFTFDINGFYLFYGKRVGQLTLQNDAGAHYLYNTNIGDAVSKGVEAYFSLGFDKISAVAKENLYRFQLFTSLSYTHARYINGQNNKGGANVSLEGNWVEGVPQWISRSGLSYQDGKWNAAIEFNFNSMCFSDANNTEFNPTGATGIVPAYSLWDLTMGRKFGTHFSINGGINNLANVAYFTRRINMYPGPGILPGDGRTFYISLSAHL